MIRNDVPGDRIDYSAQEPWLYREHPVAHYYGDIIRQLMLFAAAVLLVGAPFYGSDLPNELPFDVLGALVLACLAAFTSPVTRGILWADTIVAGVGMVLFELWALSSYQTTPLLAVSLRQGIALLFLFALYFGGKTLRGLSAREYSDELIEGGDAESQEIAQGIDDGEDESPAEDAQEGALAESYEDRDA
jgi:hypothetical protein